MKNNLVCLVFLAWLAAGGVFAQTAVQPCKVVDQGGGRSTAGGFTLYGSVGQPAVTTGSVGGTLIEGGYVPGLRRFTGTTTMSEFQVDSGWNMLSVPLIVGDYRKQSVYPTAVSSAFHYAGGYLTKDTLENNLGYWIKFNSAGLRTLLGTGIGMDTITVGKGWNMIGCLSYPVLVGDILPIAPVTLLTGVFGYSALSGYTTEDTLKPGHAYWVKVSQAGSLVMSTGSVMSAPSLPPMATYFISKASHAADDAVFNAGQWYSLRIRDQSGQERTLYYSTSVDSSDLAGLEMPPPPPSGLDVRFGSNRNVETAGGEGQTTKSINVVGAVYPVTILWDAGEEAILLVDGEEIILSAQGSMQLAKPVMQLSLRFGSSTAERVPAEYSLSQNYPNPFNPVTTLTYGLPEEGLVQLRVFNILGEEVSVLVNELKEAGTYTAEWNASSFPSGVYFCRLTAESFTETRKMVLIR